MFSSVTGTCSTAGAPTGWPPVEADEVSAVLVDKTLDMVDIPAPAGEAGANGGAGDMPVSV